MLALPRFLHVQNEQAKKKSRSMYTFFSREINISYSPVIDGTASENQ